MTPHRREETEHRVDRLGSAKHPFGDRLSKVAKRIHGAKNKVRSDAIHGIKAASCGKGIPWVRVRTFFFLGQIREGHMGHGEKLHAKRGLSPLVLGLFSKERRPDG